MTAFALALGASVLWGVGDFLGGVTSRRISTLTVLAFSQLAGLAAVAVVALALGGDFPGRGAAAAAAAAGLGGAIGLAALYRGMAVGAIAIVAPISASAAVIPVAYGLARGERPSGVQLAGIAVALVGVALAAREPHAGARVAAGVPLALIAAGGFGSYFVFIDHAAAADPLWAVVVARCASSALAVGAAAARRALTVPRGRVLVLVAIGIFDVGANVLLVLALARGYISVVSVLASLYPVVTVLLALVLLRELPARAQLAGGALALVGVALIAGG